MVTGVVGLVTGVVGLVTGVVGLVIGVVVRTGVLAGFVTLLLGEGLLVVTGRGASAGSSGTFTLTSLPVLTSTV